jgi:ribosomal protein S11
MVKAAAVLLATLVRGDDEMTMLSVRHAAALSASSTLESLSELAASGNVTQMELLVQNIAKESLSGDGIDDDIRSGLANLEQLVQQIKNSLKGEHDRDQKIVAALNECFDKAYSNLESEQSDVDQMLLGVQHMRSEFEVCRKNTHDLYIKKIEACETLDTTIKNLQWPGKKEEECIWDGSSTFGEHLKTGLSWYTSTHTSYLKTRQACWDAVKAYHEEDEKCDTQQSSFEINTCAHRQASWTACNDHFHNACAKCSIEFDETINEVECREKDRKVDWSSAEKILCYVNVLTASPSDEELKLTCEDGESCDTKWRIEEYKKCEQVCHDVDFEAGAYSEDSEGVNTTHRTGSKAMDEAIRCTRGLDIDFPFKKGCKPCPEQPPFPCETGFVSTEYSSYLLNDHVEGLEGVKECPGYMHQEWSAYSMAECRPCPALIGHDPTNHDAKCQTFGNEITIQAENDGDNYLNLAEIIVNDGIPLTATMSDSVWTTYPASSCVDGNEGNFCHGQVGAWISVKLPEPSCIHNIKVVNRKDCCQNRILGGNIEIKNQGVSVWQAGFTSTQSVYNFDFGGHRDETALCGGSTPVGNTNWKVYAGKWLYTDVDTSKCGFTETPVYVTSLTGTTSHWASKGSSEIYKATKNGFRIYLYQESSPDVANQRKYSVNWVASAAGNPPSGTCHGRSAQWTAYHSDMTQTVDTSGCKFSSTPVYITSMTGDSQHWTTTGSSEIYHADANKFTIYIDGSSPSKAAEKNYVTNYIAMDPYTKVQGACAGSATAADWKYYSGEGIYVDVDMSKCGFKQVPAIVSSLHGKSWHWKSTGSSEIYNPTTTGFRIYIKTEAVVVSEKRYAEDKYDWHMEWIAVEQ